MRRSLRWGSMVVAVTSACTTATPISIQPVQSIPATRTRSAADQLTAPIPPSVPEILELVASVVAGGPREATGGPYRRAGTLVEGRLRDAGYRVTRQAFPVPAGVSWGVPVRAGESFNVVATPPRFDPLKPSVIVGAHLDTVPQSPGANDNAAGVALLVALARAAASIDLRVPVVFIAFGAEEPRGPGDDDHHFGSRYFVQSRAVQPGLLGMVSLDRVGIGEGLRVCSGGLGRRTVARYLLARARALGVAAVPCRNRTSDHWSFEKAGFAAARLLGADDPAYHTVGDRPGVLDRAQLARAARLMWDVLRRLRPGDLR